MENIKGWHRNGGTRILINHSWKFKLYISNCNKLQKDWAALFFLTKAWKLFSYGEAHCSSMSSASEPTLMHTDRPSSSRGSQISQNTNRTKQLVNSACLFTYDGPASCFLTDWTFFSSSFLIQCLTYPRMATNLLSGQGQLWRILPSPPKETFIELSRNLICWPRFLKEISIL